MPRKLPSRRVPWIPSAQPRWSPVIALTTALVVTASVTFARPLVKHESAGPALLPGELFDDHPVSPVPGLRSDTLFFGYVGGDGYAIVDEAWTWDHGGVDPLEGWYSVDTTTQPEAYFRHITNAIWNTGTGNHVPPPVLEGEGTAWLGMFENQADSLCWETGLGYGNNWHQRLISPALPYTGTGGVTLQFTYFNDTEENFDYTRVLLRRVTTGSEVELNGAGFTGEGGLATDHPVNPPVGATFGTFLDDSHFEGDTAFQIVFELTSDGFWSDEDGRFETEYGPFGVDVVSLSGEGIGTPVNYAFETGLGGWSPGVVPGVGSFLGVSHLTNYTILDPCECELSGNVLEMHDEVLGHPDGQHEWAVSNPVDLLNDVTPVLGGNGAELSIAVRFDTYMDLPRANGVFYRPGWSYFPFDCPATGVVQWSGRVGPVDYSYVDFSGGDPVCLPWRSSATGNGVPGSGVEQVRFIYELYASCDAFGIPADVCTGETNSTPLLDNVQIEFTRTAVAPAITWTVGSRYQDGFAQTDFLDPDGVGRADAVANTNWDMLPYVLGDSLCVSGPVPTSSTRWETRLWFRIAREGPGTKPPMYNAWKAALADGKSITGGEFTFAWMDSHQIGTQTYRNKFVTYLRETGEDDYNWDGGGEFSNGNEIIRDDVLVAGCQIQYFVTANYTATPDQNYLLSDTTGGFWREFAILPTWEEAGGVFRFPCLLYIDAFNAGTEIVIESALESLGIPHDRYDYLDAGWSHRPPIQRGAPPSNNGAPLVQLLGYRTMLVSLGTYSGHAMWPHDYATLSDWLTATMCDGSSRRQALILNGDSFARGLGPAFLAQVGVTLESDAYSEYGNDPDENRCVHLEAPLGALYGTSNEMGGYEYEASGNWCPQSYSFDVLNAAGPGVGNRVYQNVSTLEETEYAQVVTEALGNGNYRTVFDGVSYDHLSRRGPGDCAPTFEDRVDAAKNEIAAALEWIFDGPAPGLCEDPCTDWDPTEVTDSASSGVTRLYMSAPNPFHPRTTLRFSLARAGDAELAVFDAAGRKVQTLAQGNRPAGLHEIVWDGTDREGRALPAGVYWSQLVTEGYSSSKKLLLLK